jgi:hypothetical protein
MYKASYAALAIRKVLSTTDKFIIGDYNGQKWYCPDAACATVDNIYAMYKPKKAQDVTAFADAGKQPKMNTIIERDGQYELVKSTVAMGDNTMLVNEKTTVLVNTQYLELMQALYPTGKLWVDTTYSYSPVRIVVRDYVNSDQRYTIVGLIMPLHR